MFLFQGSILGSSEVGAFSLRVSAYHTRKCASSPLITVEQTGQAWAVAGKKMEGTHIPDDRWYGEFK